jgi:hypothetical protein
MSARVLQFSCHRFSAADLAYLDRLTTRMIDSGIWACVQRFAGYPNQDGRVDAIAIILPGDEIPSYAIERHADGSYCLVDINSSQVIRLGRTVQAVTLGL